jgi:hypothetical protein
MSYTQEGNSVWSVSRNTWVSVCFLAHTYVFNGDGTIGSDTCTDGVNSWTKTYGYTTGNLTSETTWMRQ